MPTSTRTILRQGWRWGLPNVVQGIAKGTVGRSLVSWSGSTSCPYSAHGWPQHNRVTFVLFVKEVTSTFVSLAMAWVEVLLPTWGLRVSVPLRGSATFGTRVPSLDWERPREEGLNSDERHATSLTVVRDRWVIRFTLFSRVMTQMERNARTSDLNSGRQPDYGMVVVFLFVDFCLQIQSKVMSNFLCN